MANRFIQNQRDAPAGLATRKKGHEVRTRRQGVAALVLKMIHAVTAVAPRSRRSRLLVLKSGLALRACALGLGLSGPAHQFGVTNGSVRAKMTGDREIIDRA